MTIAADHYFFGRGNQNRFAFFNRYAAALFVVAFTASGQTLNLPSRPPGALTGSQFVTLITPMTVATRESWVLAEVLGGNVPDFLRALKPVNFSGTVNGTNHTGTYFVAPDYLAIGSDADYFLEPMSPLLAQRLCDALSCTLPTRKMVNQIWTNAEVKLTPAPFSPANYDILSVAVFNLSNEAIQAQRVTNSAPLGALVSGGKKDVIISARIYTNFANAGITHPVVIYGWHYPSGSPIQPLYNGHEETYADYSHGVRLVQNAMILDGNPTTVTQVVTNPNWAALLSDDGVAEGTTNGIIPLPRYTISAAPPVILRHPRNIAAIAGSSTVFSVLASGDSPLTYRWLQNGVSIPSAINASLLITNLQPIHAGLYSVAVSNAAGQVTSRSAWLRVNTNPLPVLFVDDFETNSAANWSLFWGASNGIPDYSVTWAFDYSVTRFTFNGVGAPIPPAPNSQPGVTRAVRLSVNSDATGSVAAVNIYPRLRQFAGSFALKFDLWMNYPGNAGGAGAAGSTQHAIFGIDHLGTQANWAAPAATSSDGLWFGVSGEGGDTRDYRSYAGNPAGLPIDLLATGGSGLTASNNTATFYQTLFPNTRFESPGAPGKNWVEVELRQTNNMVAWLLDGTVIALRTNTYPFSAGAIMLGLMDTFPSIASPAVDSFVLFDNVRVEDLDGRIRILDAVIEFNGEAQLTWSAVPGRTYVLEATTNFVTWTTVTNLTAQSGPLTATDPEASVFWQRFYRVRASGF